MGKCFSSTVWHQPRTPKKDGTTLVEMQITNISDAHQIVGCSPGGFTPLVIVPIKSVNKIGWCYIPEGFVAMMQNLGADLPGTGPGNSWSPGFHQVRPWASISRLISTQQTVFDSPVKDCKTKDNVTCNINVLIVFSIIPERAIEFVYSLGPEKLDDLLRAQQEESVRQMASETDVESIYDLHGSNTDNTLLDMNEKLGKFGVKVHSFTITAVRIPEKIAQTMQEKTLYAARAAENQVEQDLEMMILNNNQNQQKLRDELTNERDREYVKAETLKGEMSKQIAEVKAVTEKKLADIAAEERAHIAKIRADADLQVAQWDKQKASLLKEFSLSAKAEAQKIRNEATIFDKTKRAEADLEVAKMVAEGKDLLASAQGKGKEGFSALRKHELGMERLNVLENLVTKNPGLQVHSSTENLMGLVPENNLLNQAVFQGLETFKLKCAEIASTSVRAVLGSGPGSKSKTGNDVLYLTPIDDDDATTNAGNTNSTSKNSAGKQQQGGQIRSSVLSKATGGGIALAGLGGVGRAKLAMEGKKI